jgi:alkylhydroperoxidase family enzyme
MTFVETVPEGDAAGDLAQMYETDRAAYGHVPNFTKAFSHRPGVYAAWRALNGEIKAGMDLRRYELATVAAARRLRSTYCALAHGSLLLQQGARRPRCPGGRPLRRARGAAARRPHRRAPDRRRVTLDRER